MEAFLDESGTHAESRAITVAGYVISPESLPVLERKWRSLLGKYGMDELHMKEFVPPHGKYSQWPEEKKRSLFEALIGLIHQFSLVGVGAAVEMNEFVTTSHAFAHSKSPDLVKSPYQWCLLHCMVQAAAWADEEKRAGLINYTLDEGCPSRGRVQKDYALTRENEETRQKFRLGSLTFVDSKHHPAVQCADLLAYEMYREADRMIAGAERPPRGSFLALFRSHDRLGTINPGTLKKEVVRGAQIHWAALSNLPPKEKFLVMCYALRGMDEKNREVFFDMFPSFRDIYSTCITSHEMGIPINELPRELLPPDDPEWYLSRGVALTDKKNDYGSMAGDTHNEDDKPGSLPRNHEAESLREMIAGTAQALPHADKRGGHMASKQESQAQSSKIDVNRSYDTSLQSFTDALGQALITSEQLSGHPVSSRLMWASVLFTRLCTTGISILWLCPRSHVNPDGVHWDFSSIATLTRDLLECQLMFYYVAIEPVGEDEWRARLRVMQLHDCMDRLRMFRDFNPLDEKLPRIEQQANELRAQLSNNAYFAGLPESLRRELLKGDRASVLTQDEILQRMGGFEQRTRGYCRFLSAHTHSFPLAFYRMADHDRGRGVENEVDKGYMAGALEFGSSVLTETTSEMQDAFKDIVTFKPGKYRWHLLRRRRKRHRAGSR